MFQITKPKVGNYPVELKIDVDLLLLILTTYCSTKLAGGDTAPQPLIPPVMFKASLFNPYYEV